MTAEEVAAFMKVMRTYGAMHLKVGDLEIDLGVGQPDMLRLEDLERLNLGEDDPGFELSFKEKRAIQDRMRELKQQQERQDIYGAG